MQKKDLTAGMFIARGPEVNVLLRLVGSAPLLEVKSAIDLNKFYNEGEVVELKKNSIEIIDIMSYPEKYDFEMPSTTATILNEKGIDNDIPRDEETITEEFIDKCVDKYKAFIKLTMSQEQAENKLVLWLKREHAYSITQGRAILKKVKEKMTPKV